MPGCLFVINLMQMNPSRAIQQLQVRLNHKLYYYLTVLCTLQ